MPLLSKDTNFIVNLLNEETCGSSLTFEQIKIQLRETVSPLDYRRFGNCLLLLLQNRDLTPIPQQRLIIFYLFVVMYPSDSDSFGINPFAPVFLSVLLENSEHSVKHHWKISPITSQEKLFITLLVKNLLTDILSKTPNEILRSNFSTMNAPEINQTVANLREKVMERNQQYFVTSRCRLPAVINDPEVNPYTLDTLFVDLRHHSTDRRQIIEHLVAADVMNQTMCPEYLRLVPPLHESTIDELAWLTPLDSDPSAFLWDSGMCSVLNNHHAIRLMMERAFQGTLSSQLQQKLTETLDLEPNLIVHSGLCPSNLPLLVENTPLIAIQCLLRCISKDQLTEYLSALINKEMTLHSIEFVNRLSTLIQLPQDFLCLYLSASIKTCQQTKDRMLQMRLVRLATVFIESLIRNKAIDIRNLFAEVRDFCVNFSNVKEANTLSQLLRTLDLHMDTTNETHTTSDPHLIQHD